MNVTVLACGDPEYGRIVKGLLKAPRPQRESLVSFEGSWGFVSSCLVANRSSCVCVSGTGCSIVFVCNAYADIGPGHGCWWAVEGRRRFSKRFGYALRQTRVTNHEGSCTPSPALPRHSPIAISIHKSNPCFPNKKNQVSHQKG